MLENNAEHFEELDQLESSFILLNSMIFQIFFINQNGCSRLNLDFFIPKHEYWILISCVSFNMNMMISFSNERKLFFQQNRVATKLFFKPKSAKISEGKKNFFLDKMKGNEAWHISVLKNTNIQLHAHMIGLLSACFKSGGKCYGFDDEDFVDFRIFERKLNFCCSTFLKYTLKWIIFWMLYLKLLEHQYWSQNFILFGQQKSQNFAKSI